MVKTNVDYFNIINTMLSEKNKILNSITTENLNEILNAISNRKINAILIESLNAISDANIMLALKICCNKGNDLTINNLYYICNIIMILDYAKFNYNAINNEFKNNFKNLDSLLQFFYKEDFFKKIYKLTEQYKNDVLQHIMYDYAIYYLNDTQIIS